LLCLHGIQVERLIEEQEVEVETFSIDEIIPDRRLNQGHYTNTIMGKYQRKKISFPDGTWVVRTAQPLANLAAYLLEPQSNDGMAVGICLTGTYAAVGLWMLPWPVYRIMEKREMVWLALNR
jgi:hypothetical protein